MKKILLSAAALTFSMGIASAQTLIGDKFIKDDFSSADPYFEESTGRGLFWYEGTAPYSIVRNGDGKLLVNVTNATNFAPFGLSFGDDNGAEPGGNPFHVDFGTNMDIKFSITNNSESATDSAYVTIRFEDAEGGASEIHPDISAVTSDWGGPRKQKIEFLLVPGETKTINIDLSSFGSIGGLEATGWTCSSPLTCPVTEYTLNPAKITNMLFFVNGDANLPVSDRKYPNISSYNGQLVISNFSVGNVTLATNSASVVSSKLYPNPTSDVANLELNLKNASAVKVVVSDMMGKVVAEVANTNTASVKESINVANLTKGVYTVNYYVNGAPAKAEMLVVK